MSGKTISNSETRIEALKLQSSAYGVTIPWVMGVTRIPGNLVWYGGFKAIPHTETQGGKGGAVKTTNTSYTYTASVMMGLCHGPIGGLPRVWRGKKLYAGDITAAQINTAAEAYTPPGAGPMVFTVSHAAAWLALVNVTHLVLVESGDASSYMGASSLAAGTDYTAVAGVITVLRDEWRGVPLTVNYQWASGVVTRSGLAELGLTFIPGHIGQATWSGLTPAPVGERIGYSGLACVAGQDYDLGTGAQVENHTFEVVGPGAYSLGTTVPDVDPAVAMRELLTNAQYGASFPAAQLDPWQDWSNCCVATGLVISPSLTEQVRAADAVATMAELTNAAPVWSGGKLRMVPYADASATGNGRTFTASTTPVYDIDDDCFTPAAGAAPVVADMKTPADRFNHVRVQYLNRANQYAVEIVEAKDQADIDAHGLRTMPTLQAHWICDAVVAGQVAQLRLQRSLAIGSTFTFPLPAHFALLEPADIVTLVDPTLGMQRLPVRITAIDENGEGDLTITAEECPSGIASAALYGRPGGTGYQPDYNERPLDVETPMIFEPPYHLAGATGLAIAAAVTGQVGDANWGGCGVWVSSDGANYLRMGQVDAGARYGTLRAAVTDVAVTIPVQLAGLGEQIISGSAADADNSATMCYLDNGAAGEFFSYTAATLVATNQYDLTVVRAQQATTAAAAPLGAPWARLDSAVFIGDPLTPDFVGRTLYFKFTSFNRYLANEQSLAEATEYAYTVKGNMLDVAPVGATLLILKASGFVFIFPDAASVVSADPAITITAFLSGVTGDATFVAEAFDDTNTSLGAVALGGAGNVRTISAAQFVAPGGAAVHHVDITATLGTLTDGVSIRRYSIGSSGFQTRLTNPIHSVFADAAGHVLDYTGADGEHEVYQGATRLTDATTPSVAWSLTPGGNPQGLTGTINATTGAYQVTAAPDGLRLAFVTLRATVSTGEVFDDVFKLIVIWDAAGATSLRVTPRDQFVLPVDVALNVTSVGAAWTDAQMIRDTSDVTSDWTLTAEFLNCTGTFLAHRVQLTSMGALGQIGSIDNTNFAAAYAGFNWGFGTGRFVWGAGQWWITPTQGGGGWTVSGIVTSPDLLAFTGRPVGAGKQGKWLHAVCTDTTFVCLSSDFDGRTLRSSDGGATFTLGSLPTVISIYSAASGNNVILVARNGGTNEYRSIDHGANWVGVTFPHGSSSVSHAGGSDWLVRGSSGETYISHDNGTTWSGNLTPGMGLRVGDFVSNILKFRGRLIAITQGTPTTLSEVLVSVTGAAGTWQRWATPVPMGVPVAAIQVVDNVLYVLPESLVAGAKTLIYTVDGGTWKTFGSTMNISTYSHSFSAMFSPSGTSAPYIALLGSSAAVRLNLTATSDSEATVTVRANKLGEIEQVKEIPVTKGMPPSTDVYAFSANPLLLPSTADGVVTSYAGAVINGGATKNGAPDPEWSITWTTTAGVLPASGTGFPITITFVPTAVDVNFVNFVVSKTGQSVMTPSLGITKSKGADVSGLRIGKAFLPWSADGTAIGVKVMPDGSVMLQRGAAAYTMIETWYLPLSATIVNSYWARVTQTSGDALTSGVLGSYQALSAAREFRLERTVAGTYEGFFQIDMATSAAGANATTASFSLRLIVP